MRQKNFLPPEFLLLLAKIKLYQSVLQLHPVFRSSDSKATNNGDFNFMALPLICFQPFQQSSINDSKVLHLADIYLFEPPSAS